MLFEPSQNVISEGADHKIRRIAHLVSRAASWEVGLTAILLLEIVIFSLTASGFWNGAAGPLALTENFVPTGLAAIGVAIVILSGGIDLSVGSIASLCAVVMAVIWQAHVPIWLAVVFALIIGLGLGLLNGVLTVYLKIPPLIATLATGFIFSSLATALAGNNPPYGFPGAFNALGTGTIGGVVPIQLVIFAVIAVLCGVAMWRTEFGRSIVMIGYNRRAARYSGIKVSRTLLLAYILSGVLASLAGILLAAFYSAVRPDMGDDLLLPAITMAVLGGIDIFGGEGTVTGAIIAVFILGFLTQGLLILGFSDMVSTMVTGVILLIAICSKVILSGKGSQVRSRLANVFRRNSLLSGDTPGR
jgi:ribose/xylose/arabinose/galactoside ABC-type transport system permease subunit